jgi:F0F1-type ATP synthase assembly protein I
MATSDSAYHRLAMRIFADFGASIAAPAVLAALLGKWLDDRYATNPRYLILCLILALAGTALVLVRKAKRYGKEFQAMTEEDKND